ncbi:MAG: YggS family pyridoxal phosphate-dependent enzyme [Methylococcaceae bacterium]|nr:YggS family pyridoxal phosphate-dependent enzyme [Methylococcaceae bacterium]
MGLGLAESFAQVKHEIMLAEQTAGRTPGSVALLAVSKTKPAALIAEAYRLGQRHFGENYVQEAVSKQQQLSAFNISWHFIGPIQSNKTKIIASHFAWVHSVDRLKIAQRLSEQRPAHLPALNICLQVNISGEASKSGIALEELAELVDQVRQLPGLRLRGVMAIPEPETDFQRQRQPYRQLFQTVQALKHPELDTFSYGMSGDLSAAICEGATIVRIGTALFGAR